VNARRPADVAVIGGGIIGTATAAFLADAGVSVTLYESGPDVAAAASGRNAGQIMRPPDPVLVALYRTSVSAYRAIADATGFRLPSEPMGVMAVSADGDLVRRVAAAVATAQPDLRVEVLEPAQTIAAEPLLGPGLTAFRVPLGYPVRPADATHAFAALARARGASIVTGVRARPWIEAGVALGVEVAGERRPAAVVVVAAGFWTPGLIDSTGTWRPIRPMWGVIAELALPIAPRHVLEEVTPDAPLLLHHPLSSAEALPPATELAPGREVPDADLLFTLNPAPQPPGGPVTPTGLGGTFTANEPDPHRLSRTLVRNARPYLPWLDERQIAGVRACPRPTSFDGRPLIGRVPGIEGLVVAAGNGGWGISTGPATARMAAEATMAGHDGGVPAELLASRFGLPAADSRPAEGRSAD